jgi:two-component system, response regulator
MELKDLRILLIEDNPIDVNFIFKILKKYDINKNFIIASSGFETFNTLERLAKKNELPDLILLDLNLPDISGIDLLNGIKADSRFEKIPVAILTGSNVNDDIQKSYDLGAITYLVKPVSSQALKVALDTIFSVHC